jgi:HEAT repeat protein
MNQGDPGMSATRALPMVTRKRLILLLLGSTLAGLVAAFFSHPYGRQLVFGPRIRGVPLWVWQQQFRKAFANDDFIASTLAQFGVKSDQPAWHSDPDLLPVLLGLVDEPDDIIRAHVACNLGYHSGSDDAGKALVAFLDDPSELVRESAACAIFNRNLTEPYAPALAKLRERMGDESKGCRLHAAIAAYQIDRKPDEDTLRALREDLRSPVPAWRQLAVCGLCIMGADTPESFSEVAALARSSADARSTFAFYAPAYGPRAVPVLTDFLSDSLPWVRMQAARSLGKLGPESKPAIPALVRALSDPHEPTRTAAADALSKIDPERYPQK